MMILLNFSSYCPSSQGVWQCRFSYISRSAYKKDSVASTTLTTLQPTIINLGCYSRYSFPQAESIWDWKTLLNIMVRLRIQPWTTRWTTTRHNYWSPSLLNRHILKPTTKSIYDSNNRDWGEIRYRVRALLMNTRKTKDSWVAAGITNMTKRMKRSSLNIRFIDPYLNIQ